jgi:predicted ATPase with chaperone activity
VRVSPQRLARYRDRLSRALLDRFDIVVTAPRPRTTELQAAAAEGSDAVRARSSRPREHIAEALAYRAPPELSA